MGVLKFSDKLSAFFSLPLQRFFQLEIRQIVCGLGGIVLIVGVLGLAKLSPQSFGISALAEEIAPELWVNRRAENWQALETFSGKGTIGNSPPPAAYGIGGKSVNHPPIRNPKRIPVRVRPFVAAAPSKGLAPPTYADQSPFSPKQRTIHSAPQMQPSRDQGRFRGNAEDRERPAIERQPLPPPGARLAVNAVRPAQQVRPVALGNLKIFSGEAWKNISIGQFEKLAASFRFPLASTASQKLLLRLLLSPSPAHFAAQGTRLRFEAVRLDLLLRMGAFGFVEQVTENLEGAEFDELKAVYRALSGFARLGSYRKNCDLMDPITGRQQGLPSRLRKSALALKVYCAVRRSSMDEATLLVNAAQEQGGIGRVPAQVMSYLSGAGKLPSSKVKSFALVDYLFLELIGRTLSRSVLEKAEAGVLMRIARSKNQHLIFRLFAAEKLARSMPEDASEILMVLYQQWSDRQDIQKGNPASERAVYLKQFRQAISNNDKTAIEESLPRLMAVSRRAGLLPVIAHMIKDDVQKLQPAEAAPAVSASVVAMLLARNETRQAFHWLIKGPRQKAGPAFMPANWLPLVEIADTHKILPSGSGFQAAADLIRARRLGGLALHKYITVAESLRYNVPIKIWQTISNDPQPTKGYLPPTGALAAVRKAAQNKASGQLVLMLVVASGRGGVGDMHLIALRDVIRAFVDAGLEDEARALGFEALSPVWPS